MEENFEDLQQLLESQHIPVVKPHFGFLELINKPESETINSQIYAHFLACPIPEIRDTFLNSLLEIIESKGWKTVPIFEPFIRTELSTKSGKRIDIVIDDHHQQSAIIIENKVFSELNNDLVDYWEHFKQYQEKRIGVVLTLHKTEIPEIVKNNYVNITHQEWIDEVCERIEFYKLPPNYSLYLSDFINTIRTLTKSYVMDETAKFYFENARKINELLGAKQVALNFIENQLNRAAQSLGLKLKGTNQNWRYFRDNDNNLNVFVSIILEQVYEGHKQIMLILELQEEAMEKEQELLVLFKGLPLGEKKLGERRKHHIHFFTQSYNLSDSEFENLGDTITNLIRSDFAELTVAAIKYIYPMADISRWEKQFLGRQS